MTHVPGGVSVTAIKGASLEVTSPVTARLTSSDQHTVSYEPVGGSFAITPQFVNQVLGETKALIIIDEYDRFSNVFTNVAIADLIKHLSDSDSETKLMVVGVAESVSELLGSHPSIGRSVAEVRLDRMNPADLDQILSHGFSKLGLECAAKLAGRIVDISDGYPHFTHLLGLKTANAFANRCLDQFDQPLKVIPEDYRTALHAAIEGSQETLQKAFQLATQTVKRKSDLFLRVLEGMAFATSPDVQVNELVKNINHIYGTTYKVQSISYHLGELVEVDRGRILVRSRVGFYKFRDPMMRAFVRVRLERKNYELFHGQLQFPFMRAHAE